MKSIVQPLRIIVNAAFGGYSALWNETSLKVWFGANASKATLASLRTLNLDCSDELRAGFRLTLPICA